MIPISIFIGNENNDDDPSNIDGVFLEINDPDQTMKKALMNVKTDLLNGYKKTISYMLDKLTVDNPKYVEFVQIFLEKQDYFQVYFESSGYISKIILKNIKDGGYITFEFF